MKDRKNAQTCNKRLQSCLIDVSLVEVANVARNWLICAENRICSAGESFSDQTTVQLNCPLNDFRPLHSNCRNEESLRDLLFVISVVAGLCNTWACVCVNIGDGDGTFELFLGYVQ